MDVSKWDLYMILKISLTEIKKIFNLISTESDPISVNVHQLLILLLLSRC